MICGKAFVSSEELELHSRRMHDSDKEDACYYGRPAKKRRPARGLEDPIGNRTWHDFTIA
jgi:hypothetical protein